MTSHTKFFTPSYRLTILIVLFLGICPILLRAENNNIVRYNLCKQGLFRGSQLTISDVLAQKIEKRKIWVFPLKTEMELFLIGGVYPPYYYGHELLDMTVQRLTGTERILILGVGSGYDAILLQKKFPNLNIEAIDISSTAVINTELNLAFHNVRGVKVYVSNLFSNVEGKFDVVVFNAPRNIEVLAGTVAESVDKTRLDLGGKILCKFLKQLSSYLNQNGNAFLMTNAAIEFDPTLKPRRLTTGSWDRFAPSKGSYGIFLLNPKVSRR